MAEATTETTDTAASAAQTDAAKEKKDAAADKGKGADEGKLTLTQVEFDQRVAAAVKSERQRIESEKEKERRKAEEEAAKERGEFKELHATEKAAREQAEKDLATERLSKRVIRALTVEAGRHPGYDAGKLESYLYDRIVGGLKSEAADDAVAKAVAEAVKQFVADFPTQAKGGGAPPAMPGTRSTLPAKPPTQSTTGPNGQPRVSNLVKQF